MIRSLRKVLLCFFFLERDQYDRKIYRLLEDNSARVNEAFNFLARVTEVKSMINKCEYAINGSFVKKIILLSNPVPNELPKIHKAGNPMCPTSPLSYQISRLMA